MEIRRKKNLTHGEIHALFQPENILGGGGEGQKRSLFCPSQKEADSHSVAGKNRQENSLSLKTDNAR